MCGDGDISPAARSYPARRVYESADDAHSAQPARRSWRRLLDEHTAALDPKTAAKVLETTEKIVSRDQLTTLMITHNMRDAIAHGNRLIMMYDGKIVVDVSGEEKKKLTVEDLLAKFGQASGSDEADDKLLLS